MATNGLTAELSWQVTNNSYGRDHRSIEIGLGNYGFKDYVGRESLKLGKVNWKSFDEQIEREMNEIIQNEERECNEKKYANLVKWIRETFLTNGAKVAKGNRTGKFENAI